ncbi:MAG: glycine zipper 2TM domain-containing protein, partial [Ramlibacter sp.]
QVQVPRQVCSNQPVAVQQPRSGAGSVIGAVAGGLLGNTIGGGSGRAAATVLGVVGGAVVGDRIEGNSVAQVQNVTSCTTQVTLENRTVGYNVAYEYAGNQYSVQMPQDPGPTIRLQLSPVGSNMAPPAADAYAAGTYPGGGIPILNQVIVPSTVAYPVYYGNPYYYPSVGVSLGIGYGYHHGYGHRGHYRY